MNRLNIAESAVFLYSSFYLFLKDPFFQMFWGGCKLIHHYNTYYWLAHAKFTVCISEQQRLRQKVSEYDQELPQSHAADQPTVP